LSYLLSSALASYELERVGGVTLGNSEFQQAVKHHVPEGHTFKALPVQFSHMDPEKIMHHLFTHKVGREIVGATGGDQMKHALRVKIVPYPENVCAVWVMIAVRFRSFPA
jgi:centrosomal protein CEP76